MNNGNNVLILEISSNTKNKEKEKNNGYLSLEIKMLSLTSIS